MHQGTSPAHHWYAAQQATSKSGYRRSTQPSAELGKGSRFLLQGPNLKGHATLTPT